jgi:phage terminase large subunit-like protein
MRNVVIIIDTNENIRPDKKRSTEKIDGIAAAITAIGGWMAVTMDTSNIIYQDHGLRSIRM